MTGGRYLEDLEEGDRFASPDRTVTQDEMIAFARQFDPQPFHLDPAAAKSSFFGQLVASGWHTTALMMRLIVESGMDVAHGVIGFAMESLRWPTPLLPETTVHAVTEILAARRSESRPGFGIVRFRTQVLGADGRIYEEITGNMIVPMLPAEHRALRDLAVARVAAESERDGGALAVLLSPEIRVEWPFEGVSVVGIGEVQRAFEERWRARKPGPLRIRRSWLVGSEGILTEEQLPARADDAGVVRFALRTFRDEVLLSEVLYPSREASLGD